MYAEDEKGELLATFGCLSDLHTEYSMITCTDVEKVRLRETITKALTRMGEREDIDVMLFGGDYTSQVTAKSQAHWEKSRQLLVNASRAVFKGSNTPVVYIGGNHEFDASGYGNQTPAYKSYSCWDYYSLPMKEDIGVLRDADYCVEVCQNPTSKPEKKDSIYMISAFYYQIDGFDFLCLNTGKYLAQQNNWYYYSRESVEWIGKKLEELYAEDPDRTVFFLCHIPFNDSNSLSSSDKGQNRPSSVPLESNGLSTDIMLKQILAKYPNTVMLYGHDHGKNSSMIHERTSQRITRYNGEGKKMLSQFDDTHIDADKGSGSDTPQGVTSGTFYLHNVGNGKYFGNDGANVTMSDTPIKADVALIDGGLFKTTFEGKYNLSCGGSGRFSLKERITQTNTQENGLWYCVEDTEATPLVATQVTSLVAGRKYIIVQYYQGNYALGNSIFGSGSSARIESVGVTISGSSISFANYDAAKNYVYELEPLENPVTSGAFYFHNLGNGKYFGNDGANVTMSDTPIKADVALIDGGLFKTTFEGKYNLSCGGSGRFSLKERITQTNTQENGLWYCVEDTEATPLVATQVTSLVAGRKYIIVQYYQGNYALGNSIFGSGSSARIESVGVTISGSSISFANYDAAKNYIYVIESAESGRQEEEPAEEEGDEVSSFYLKNVANGQYLVNKPSGAIGFSDMLSKEHLSFIKNSENKFKCIYNYDPKGKTQQTLDCSKGLFVFDVPATDNDRCNGSWYQVDDISADVIVAGRTTELQTGKYYLIVNTHLKKSYALSNFPTENLQTGAKGIGSTEVTVESDTIRMDKSLLENCIYTLEKYEEIPSFFSVFLGSCRYYDNDIDGGWTSENYEKPSKVIQGLMIYVYTDRIEFHMKNYGDEFGNVTKRSDNKTPSGQIINEELVPYIVYRKMEKHTGREPQPMPTNINEISAAGSELFYNVYGMPVNEDYKGIVIDGATGQKYLKE